MKNKMIVNDELRMKFVNFLRVYGYYEGVLVSLECEKRYISGELLITDIIKSKKDFKELKLSVNKVLDYCYENGFKEIEKKLTKIIRDNFHNPNESLEYTRVMNESLECMNSLIKQIRGRVM